MRDPRATKSSKTRRNGVRCKFNDVEQRGAGRWGSWALFLGGGGKGRGGGSLLPSLGPNEIVKWY